MRNPSQIPGRRLRSFLGARAWVALRVLSVAGITGQAAPPLSVEFGDLGLRSLHVEGTPLLHDGRFRITAAHFVRPDGTVTSFPKAMPPQVTVDIAGPRVRHRYPWGTVETSYRVRTNQLTFTVEVLNETPDLTLVSLHVELLQLIFPSRPAGLNGRAQMRTTLGAPAIAVADWSAGRVVVAADDVTRPLAIGFGPPADAEHRVYPVLLFTGRHPLFPHTFPFINRPLPPGGRDTYRASLRAGAPKADVTEDLYTAFAAAFPFRVQWTDRRPIGMLFASSRGYVSELNPRGWVSRKYNAAADQDRSEFKKAMMDMAERAVALCREAEAQGVILWDPEGQEWPHPVSYLGDPRSLPPEMDAVADEFFAVFTRAGLRTGVCLRWQRPVRSAYKPEVVQLPLWDRRQRVSEVVARMEQARRRWDCTLFYLDSNAVWTDDPVQYLPQPAYGRDLDAMALSRILERMPDCLIIPEHEDLQTYAYGAPYIDLRVEKTPGTASWVRRAYPGAFSVVAIGESPMTDYHDRLVEAVSQGDILMFRAWYRDSTFDPMKRIYAEAMQRKVTNRAP